jgi:hypothetical protein
MRFRRKSQLESFAQSLRTGSRLLALGLRLLQSLFQCKSRPVGGFCRTANNVVTAFYFWLSSRIPCSNFSWHSMQ